MKKEEKQFILVPNDLVKVFCEISKKENIKIRKKKFTDFNYTMFEVNDLNVKTKNKVKI